MHHDYTSILLAVIIWCGGWGGVVASISSKKGYGPDPGFFAGLLYGPFGFFFWASKAYKLTEAQMRWVTDGLTLPRAFTEEEEADAPTVLVIQTNPQVRRNGSSVSEPGSDEPVRKSA